jgi:hypothetical protein
MIPALKESALRDSPQRLKPGRLAASSQTPLKRAEPHGLDLGRVPPISTDPAWTEDLDQRRAAYPNGPKWRAVKTRPNCRSAERRRPASDPYAVTSTPSD